MMKNSSFIILYAAVLFMFPGGLNSQISLKVGPVIGLTTPTGDYSGDTKDFYAGTQYGLRPGFNFGAVGKVGILSLNGRASISYSILSNEGTADPTRTNSTVKIDHKIVLITLGPEFSFAIPMSPIKPYAGIDLLLSSISGTFDFQGSTPDGLTGGERSIQSASRTGIGFAVGSELKLGNINLDLSIRYNLHNLFGKEYINSDNSNKTGVYTSLNDEKDPLYPSSDDKHPIGNDRTIATIQVQLGILFGF